MNLQLVSTTQVQRNLASILNYLDEPVIVVRDSKPEAVLLPYDDYSKFVKKSRADLALSIKRSLAGIKSKFDDLTDKQLDRLITQAKTYARRRGRH